ncbi:MAG: hypothetical protein ABEH77_00265 [Halobacteriaceae archaeon]
MSLRTELRWVWLEVVLAGFRLRYWLAWKLMPTDKHATLRKLDDVHRRLDQLGNDRHDSECGKIEVRSVQRRLDYRLNMMHPDEIESAERALADTDRER